MPTRSLGLGEIQSAFRELPDRMQQNVLRAGNRALANAVRKEIEAAGGDVPETVRRAATAQPNPRSRATKGFFVGLRRPFSAMGHWFEFGTGPRWTKAGKYAGRMPATPWLRPALERIGIAKAEAIWTKAASRNLERQIRKLGNDR